MAIDIKNCQNACQTYSLEHWLVKACTAMAWKAKFSAFVKLFQKRKGDLSLVMQTFQTLCMLDREEREAAAAIAQAEATKRFVWSNNAV